ncbi:MAG: hypothetical protein RR136_05295, partial [Clostridia bacterium]
ANVPSGYELQYKIGSGNWAKYTNVVVVDTNVTIHGRVYNIALDDEIGSNSYNVTKIDKTSPTKVIVNLNGYVSGNWTNGNVTQTFSSSDTQSGINKYQYTVDNGINWSDCPNPWVINWDGQWTFNIRAIDNVGNISESSNSYIIRRDAVAPSKPTLPDLINGHDTGISNTDNITMWWWEIKIEGRVDPGTIVHLRNYSVSNDPIVTSADSNGYWSLIINLAQNVWNSIYVWSGDESGNWTQSDELRVYSDTVAPTVPNVVYNSGANTCCWKNNYNLSLNSTDSATGIWKYQTNHYSDGNVNREIGSNFIPENGYNTCTDRYRAVDGAGNVSGWTGVNHIHMDTELPWISDFGYTVTSNSITITGVTSGDNSGIVSYRHHIPGVWWNDPGISSQNATIPNLASNTTYNVEVRVTDHAGNVRAITKNITTLDDANIIAKRVKPGDYIAYPTINGYSGGWRVLTNKSGIVEIVSAKSVQNLTMIGKADYINAVNILNNVCSRYVNTTYATSGRSIGTTSQSIGNIGDSGIVWNANAKDVRLNDTYYQNDIYALSVAGIRLDDWTWLGSREVEQGSVISAFIVRYVYIDDGVNNNYLYLLNNGGNTYENSSTFGVGAVVSLKSGIKVTAGEGTQESPYQIGI